MPDEDEKDSRARYLAENDEELHRLFGDVVEASVQYGTNTVTYNEAKLAVVRYVRDNLRREE